MEGLADDSIADGFIEPHVQVFDDLLSSPLFVSAVDTAAAYATQHSSIGGFPDPSHMRTLLGQLLASAKACIPQVDSLQMVRCPELQAVALLIERLTAPQQMAWLLGECHSELQQLPLEHLLDRVRERAVGAARVSQRLLTPQWFDPALPAATLQHGCNLLDRFLYALVVASSSQGSAADDGVWFPARHGIVSWRSPFNTVPNVMVARGATGVLASVALHETFLTPRGHDLFAALLPPPPTPAARSPFDPLLPTAAAAAIDPTTRAHAEAVRRHMNHLVDLIPHDNYFRGITALVPRLMHGLRPSELVALAVLTTPHLGLVCPHSGLPMPEGRGWSGVGYPAAAAQTRERTTRRRSECAAAVRASLLGSRCGAAAVVGLEPRAYVEALLLGADPFLNVKLAPGVLLPAPPHDAASLQPYGVVVKTLSGKSATDGQDAHSGLASVAARDVGDAGRAAAYVDSHLRFMRDHRPGVILAGDEEAALRKHAPSLLLQLAGRGAAVAGGSRDGLVALSAERLPRGVASPATPKPAAYFPWVVPPHPQQALPQLLPHLLPLQAQQAPLLLQLLPAPPVLLPAVPVQPVQPPPPAAAVAMAAAPAPPQQQRQSKRLLALAQAGGGGWGSQKKAKKVKKEVLPPKSHKRKAM